jgi:hypothetical protein
MNTNKYLILNDENVVINISVGPTEAANERQSPDVDVGIGWKLNDELNIFLPSGMTTEDFNEIKTQFINKCVELKSYYDLLVKHEAFNSLTAELKAEVTDWLSDLNTMHTNISTNNELVLMYRGPNLKNVSTYEPLPVRPNLENEV